MLRKQATRVTSRRTALNWKPRVPTPEVKEQTAHVFPNDRAPIATSIMNGARGTRMFPRGTLASTFRKRLPYFFGGLATSAVFMGWPALVVFASDAINDVPPDDTALVRRTEDGQYVCLEIPLVGLTQGEEDE